MASGRINGTVSKNSSGYEFYILWSSTPNTTNNTSSVTATAYARAKTSEWASDTVNSNFTQKITINGQSSSQNIRVNIKRDTEPVKLISYTTTVAHNSNGTKSITISANCKLGTASYSPGTGTASGTAKLDNIDRTAPTVNFTIGTPTETTIPISATSNVSCDNWGYSLNGGAFKTFSTSSGTSKSYTITGLEPDTTYKIIVRAQKVSNNVYGQSSAKSATTEPDTPAPLTKFSAVCAGSNKYLNGTAVTLSWSGTAGTVTGYRIEYATQPMNGSMSSWKVLTTISSSSLSGTYKDSGSARLGLPAGTRLIYRIAALNDDNVSPYKQSNTLIRTGGMWINTGSTFKFGTVWVNQNGTWKRAARIWFNNGGTWTQGG